MHHIRDLDPVDHSNFAKCIAEFRHQMEIRLEKTKQCNEQIRGDIACICSILQIPTALEQFPYVLLEDKCENMIHKFEANMTRWIMKKSKASTTLIPIAKMREHGKGECAEEADFFALCFITMNDYIQNRVELAQDIKLLMMLRYALIVFKRCHQWNDHSGIYPIFRHKATVICSALHKELDKRHAKLSIVKWYRNRKAAAVLNNKRAVKAKEFCSNLHDYLEYLYYAQQQTIVNKTNWNLGILNTIQFTDQQITVCDAVDTMSNDVDITHILKYFEPETHSKQSVFESDEKEEKDETVLFTDTVTTVWSVSTNSGDSGTNMDSLVGMRFLDEIENNPSISSPLLGHDIDPYSCFHCAQSSAQISDLRNQVERLQANYAELQRKYKNSQAEIQTLRLQLRKYAHPQKHFQSVPWDRTTAQNRAHAVNFHIQSLHRERNNNYPSNVMRSHNMM